MSRPDATASAALSLQVIKPVYFAFLDFVNEPIRANTAGCDFTISGSGVPDLDGSYDGINGDFVNVGEIKQSEGGNDSVEVTLSALLDLDNDMLNEIGDQANWKGRLVRMWRLIRDENDAAQGGYQHYYTGYMSDLSVRAAPSDQLIKLTIEGYISAFSRPSGRTYLDQERFDPGDLSARAAIAIANGTSGNPLTNNTPTPGGGGGGNYGDKYYRGGINLER